MSCEEKELDLITSVMYPDIWNLRCSHSRQLCKWAIRYRAPPSLFPLGALFHRAVLGWATRKTWLASAGWDDSFRVLPDWPSHSLVMGPLDLVEFRWPCCGVWLWFPKSLHRDVQLQLSGGHQTLCSGCWLCVHHPNPPPWHWTPHQPLHTQGPLLPYSAGVLLLVHSRCHVSSLPLVKENPGLKVPTLTSELINKAGITQAM